MANSSRKPLHSVTIDWQHKKVRSTTGEKKPFNFVLYLFNYEFNSKALNSKVLVYKNYLKTAALPKVMYYKALKICKSYI